MYGTIFLQFVFLLKFPGYCPDFLSLTSKTNPSQMILYEKWQFISPQLHCYMITEMSVGERYAGYWIPRIGFLFLSDAQSV